MKLAEFTNKCHMAAHFSELNLNSSIIDAIILTNLIFLAAMLEMPTLNDFSVIVHVGSDTLVDLSPSQCCCFLKILAISLKSGGCKSYHFAFKVGISSIAARNIRLVNIIASMIEEFLSLHFQ
jgi:hypothetical protein